MYFSDETHIARFLLGCIFLEPAEDRFLSLRRYSVDFCVVAAQFVGSVVVGKDRVSRIFLAVRYLQRETPNGYRLISGLLGNHLVSGYVDNKRARAMKLVALRLLAAGSWRHA